MSVFVVGGSRGIGRAIAEGLASDSSHVFVNHHEQPSEAEEARRALDELGAAGGPRRGDVSTP